MNTIGSMSDRANDAKEQIAKLREQVEMLMRERVTPAFGTVAGHAETTARAAADMAQEHAEALSGRVREQPLAAMLIAAGVGFLLGRFVR